MLRFFRHIRKTLMEHLPAGQAGSKVRTYFLYAIGEIALVMIGILLALQVNNWNEQRIENDLEQFYLQNLITDLESQLFEIERQRYGEELVVFGLNRITSQINEGFKDSNLEQFNKDIQSATITRTLNLYDATFEDLKSTGNMNLIRNQELKQGILDHFQFSNRIVYVIRKNAESYHHAIAQGLMSSDLINMDIRGVSERVAYEPDLYDSINVVRFDPEIEAAFNEGLEQKLSDIDNQQLIKNFVTQRRWTAEVSIVFLNTLESRTKELIKELKTEIE